MSGLLHREDIDEVRKRLTVWWNDGDIGRPVMLITAPRANPADIVKPVARPEGWIIGNSSGNFDYRVYLSATDCNHGYFLGESVPVTAPYLGGAGSLALFLGCTGKEMPDTVWFEPCIKDPEEAVFGYDPNNFYWDFTLRLARESVRLGQGKFLVEFPDLIEGLDTLSAMRGTEGLLSDLTDRPKWVRRSLRRITDLYFHYYDILYDILRDGTGGSSYFGWAPGRMAKFQCDCSAMISPKMFREFMLPVLTEMCERVSYCIYHLDGPGALGHHDAVLSIPKLKVLEWTPGAGNEPVFHRKWWPLYHKTIESGKRVYLRHNGKYDLDPLKREFGNKLKKFMLSMHVERPEQAKEILERAVL